MGNKPHSCETCLKICDEAKEYVKVLQKRIYILTIVCTAAITLLGEQGAKALLSVINTTTEAIKATEEQSVDKKTEDQKNIIHNKIAIDEIAWKVLNQNYFLRYPNNEFTKKYELVDELSRLPKTTENNPVEALDENTIKQIVSTATAKTNLIPIPFIKISNQKLTIADNHSLFFTPSSLPFDVYSTTLALGNNYGFGDYYGINDYTWIPNTSVPGSGVLATIGFALILKSNLRF